MSRVVCVVQARMGSTRLPGKVLADLCGKPTLQRVIERLRRSKSLDEIVVATSVLHQDDAVSDLARSLDVPVFRGSESDVLDRYVKTGRVFSADIVVRITSDCPLIDPGVVDRAVRMLEIHNTDFLSNSVQRTFPRGLDTEVMPMDVLERTARMAHSPNAREHVTYHIYAESPDRFVIRHLKDQVDHSSLSWTLDTPQDLEYLRRIYDDCDYRELIQRCLA